MIINQLTYHKVSIKRFLFLAASLVLIFFSSCQNEVNEFKWLEGKWKRQFNATTQFEDWKLLQDTLKGVFSYTAFGDTQQTEVKTIYRDGDEIILKLSNTENKIAEILELTSAQDSSLEFTNINQNHYPQQFIIERQNDSLFFQHKARLNNFQKGVLYDYALVD